MCVTRQQITFEGRVIAATYPRPDIASMAKGLAGELPCWTSRVETLTELKAALADYFGGYRHLTGVLDIVLREEEYPPFWSIRPQFKETGSPFS